MGAAGIRGTRIEVALDWHWTRSPGWTEAVLAFVASQPDPTYSLLEG
jgi:hypothetical protein